MSGKAGRAFYELEIYKRYEKVADMLWDAVEHWAPSHKRHPGEQMLEAVDSVGANIAEAIGRAHFKDSQNFLIYARGSMAETEHWIRQSVRRKLFKQEIIETLRNDSRILHRQLNSFMSSQRPLPKISPRKPGNGIGDSESSTVVQEEASDYANVDSDCLTGTLESAVNCQEPRAKSQERSIASRTPRRILRRGLRT